MTMGPLLVSSRTLNCSGAAATVGAGGGGVGAAVAVSAGGGAFSAQAMVKAASATPADLSRFMGNSGLRSAKRKALTNRQPGDSATGSNGKGNARRGELYGVERRAVEGGPRQTAITAD